MKFFNLDCHVSVISDLKNIFESLGHSVDLWSLSGHKWIFNFPRCSSPVINEWNWKGLNEEMANAFFCAHYDELDKYDAFICAYPPLFLKLFERFNKPIIVVAATRYDFPAIDDERLEWLEHSLNHNKNLVLIANNAFDQKYCEHFLNRKWTHIPSLCKYTNTRYTGIDERSVVFSKFPIELSNNLIHQSSLGIYSWQNLYSFKSIIHFPYNVSTMSLFEQCSAGVPVLVPTLEFCIKLMQAGYPLFSEITFPNNNPNRQSAQFINHQWLQHCDFYNGTLKVHYFSSFGELKSIVSTRESLSEDRSSDIIEKWKNIISQL